jgi:hypothetical protein
MTGLLRAEWHMCWNSMVTPCNWSQSIYAHVYPSYSPLRYLVADARNLIIQKAIQDNFEWLIFIDHDVLIPGDFLIKMNKYMLEDKYPIVGGLYFTKSIPAEPLIYRGQGNSYYNKWKLGEKVMVGGMGLGCHLIKVKLLKAMYDAAPAYDVMAGVKARRVYESPSQILIDTETGQFLSAKGTEDLPWYERIVTEGWLKKVGYPELAKLKYPFVCDTSMFCRHISSDGIQFPCRGEEQEFK